MNSRYRPNRHNLRQLLDSDSLSMLRSIHKDSAGLEHAIWNQGKWQSYIPSHFIYAFFTFNTLYNIDWKSSIKNGSICLHTEPGDLKKMYRYLNFCNCDEFLVQYREFFVQYIEEHWDIDEVLAKFERIYPDDSVTEDILNNFKSACKRCFKDGECNREILDHIVTLIYKIRCNLFHGHKTLEELSNTYQQERLDIYSVMIIAINQMVFSYLQYLNNERMSQCDIELLIERLRWKPGQS